MYLLEGQGSGIGAIPIQGEVATPDHFLDHTLEPQSAAVVRRINAGDPVVLQFLDLVRENGPPPSSENADMSAPVFMKEVVDVFEEFHVAALVARDGDTLYILFHRRFHDLPNAPVVSQ